MRPRDGMGWWTRARALLWCAALVGGCEQVDQARDRFREQTPHEAYAQGLADAGLLETALGRGWLAASRSAVEDATPVSLPFREEGFISPEAPSAVGYRVRVGQGQRLTIDVRVESADRARVFVDLFRVPRDPRDAYRPVLSADSVPGSLAYEPWRSGEFILRVQPELLRGGHYRVTLTLEAQLAFPVQGRSVRSIQSAYGAPREGGRRSHEGVDIFARRGTPVLAAGDGVVSRVQVTPIGGKVVWLRDGARRASIYYAHLDSQAVRRGQRVRAGDVLGFVGNTGNARTTPPHLHFGVYRRGEGAVDPDPFLRPPPGRMAELAVDLGSLGSWVRVRNDGLRLRQAPTRRAPVLREMDRYTAARVVGGSGDWYRVRLPDGEEGYVAARLTESVDHPLETRTAAAGDRIRVEPAQGAPAITTLDRSAEVPVLGRYDRFLYVRTASGARGWLEVDAQKE